MGSLAGGCDGVNAVRCRAAPVGAYCVTSRRVIVKNGYTGRDLQVLELDDIADVTVYQGPIAQFFDIGTVMITSATGDRVLSFRGIRGPEVIKTRIDALKT